MHLKIRQKVDLFETVFSSAFQGLKEEIAKNGIDEGFDNLTISKITKLSIEKIEELRNEQR